MTTLELKYNSFTVKTDFFINGNKASLKCFGTGDNVRLRQYIDDFFHEAIDKSHVGPGEECIIQFFGTQDAFEDVEAAYRKYSAQSDGVKIELAKHKPYPNNLNEVNRLFNEMNKLIDEKKKLFADQIALKKEELINPSAGKSNVELSDVVKRFDMDKATIERIYSDNLDEKNAVIEKAKEGVDFSSLAKRIHIPPPPPPKVLEMPIAVERNNYSLEKKDAKAYYDKIKEKYNLYYTKTCEELADLLISLLKKIDTALYSGFEAVYNDYTAAYPDFLALNYPLQKYKQSSSFAIKRTIPDSCFTSMEIKPSSVKIGTAKIGEMVLQTASLCQKHFDSVFKSAKKDFILETEKCKTYYLEELQKWQDTIKEKLTSTKHIEQEITAFENKIECLDELQNEINKLTPN